MTTTQAFVVTCDWPSCKKTKTVADRNITLSRAVSELRNCHWDMTKTGDYCPVHARSKGGL